MAESDPLLEASVVIKGDTVGAVKSINDVKSTAEKATPAIRTMDSAMQKFFENLKGQAGRGSVFDEFTKVLVGGGAIVAVGAITHELSAAAEKAADLAVQFQRGQITAQGLASGLLSSIPIFGELYDAASSVIGAIDGSTIATQKFNEAQEAGMAAMVEKQKLFLDFQERQRQEQIAYVRESRSIAGEETMAGLDPSTIGARVQAVHEEATEKKATLDEHAEETRRHNEETLNALDEKNDAVTKMLKLQVDTTGLSDEDKMIRKHQLDEDNASAHLVNQTRTDKANLNTQANVEALKKAIDTTETEKTQHIQTGDFERAHLQAANLSIGADTIDKKVAAVTSQKSAEGHDSFESYQFGAIERQKLIAEAAANSTKQIEKLNDALKDQSARSYGDKLLANLSKLNEQAAHGEISPDKIDEMQEAFGKGLEQDDIQKMQDLQFSIGEIGNTDLQKQVDQMGRFASDAFDATQTTALLKQQLDDTADIVAKIKTDELGLDAVQKEIYEAQNITGGDVNKAAARSGAYDAKELAMQFLTPLQQYSKAIQRIDDDIKYGGLSPEIAQRARYAATAQLTSSVQEKDIGSFVMDNLKLQFAQFALGPLHSQEGNTAAVKANTAAISKGTDIMKANTAAISKGADIMNELHKSPQGYAP